MEPVAPASAPPAETADPITPSDALASLDPKELQAWKETGDLPVRAPVEDDGDDEPEPAAAAPVAGAAPSAPVSKRQARINEQIRTAVEAATKADRDELARLRAAQPPPRPEPRVAPAAVAPSVDPSDPEPDFNDATKYPGGEFDPKYSRDIARWDNRQERRQEQAASQARERDQQQEHAFRASAKAAAEAWEKKAAADPEFKTRLNPELMTSLIPASQIPLDPKTGDRLFPLGPLNVIAQEMLDHPDTAPDVAEYLSTHPEDLARLTATDPTTGVPLLSAKQLIREIGRIEGALSRGVEPLPLPNAITDAPAPPTTLGHRSTTPVDAAESAMKRGDVAAYIAAENAKEVAAYAARK